MKPRRKRFPMPAGSRLKSLVIRELCGADERMAAETAAALLPATADGRQVVVTSQREATKISICEIDGAAVDHSLPLFAVDGWRRKDLAALDRFFSAVNGVTEAEVKAMFASAVQLSDGEGHYGTSFTLPEGCVPATIEIWETTGDDEVAAARSIEGSKTIGMADRVLLQRRALVGRVIRGVTPDWDAWKMRASTAISLCYQQVNSIPDGELEGLVAAAEDVGETTAEMDSPPSSLIQQAAEAASL